MSLTKCNADVNHPSHTQGPVDGSLYATVAKNSKSSKGITFAVTNGCDVDMTDEGPHTTSIDSGISSTTSVPQQHSPYARLTNGTSHDPPSAINVEAEIHQQNPQSGKMNGNYGNFSGDQAELDELLNGLLKQIASFPDPISKTNKYEKNYSTSAPTNNTYLSTKFSTTSKPEQNAPKYNENSGNSSLSGETFPSRFVSRYQPSSWSTDETPYHTRAGSRPFSYGVTAGSPALQRRRMLSESSAYVCESTPSKPVEDDVFTDTSDDLTWLQKQQQKLRARREIRGLEDRQWREQMLFAELRGTVSKRLPKEKSSSPSPSLTNQIHVNTNGHSPSPLSLSMGKPPMASLTRQLSAPTSPVTPTRVSSRNVTLTRYPTQSWQNPQRSLQRKLSDTSFDRNERPFVAVKKAHQLNREQMSAYGTTPEQALVSSPVYGNFYSYQQNSYSPYNRNLDYTSKEESPPRSQIADDDSISVTYSSVHQSTPKNTYVEPPSSWSPSLVSNSPPCSPSQNIDRPQTPQFPLTPRTPYANQEVSIRKASTPTETTFQQIKDGFGEISSTLDNGGEDSPSVYYGQSRRSSMLSLNDSEVISQHPLFMKDTSKFWYKPKISREEAINFLRDKPPGTFIVRDSNSFPGAFGIAMKVANLPPNVQNKTGDISTELVRHFLIEPTSKGVQLKGCANEPVFGSLSALIYQHSVTPMALPCKLIIPDREPCLDTVDGIVSSLSVESEAASELLTQGAACNVFYLITVDTECLTGPQAVRKSISELLQMKPSQVPTIVHLKVSSKGITLTDNSHRLFFRRHYSLNSISHCGLDPDDRRWTSQSVGSGTHAGSSHLFAFVARKAASKTDNQCHVFAEYESEQPASAIVSFVNKVLVTGGSQR